MLKHAQAAGNMPQIPRSRPSRAFLLCAGAEALRSAKVRVCGATDRVMSAIWRM